MPLIVHLVDLVADKGAFLRSQAGVIERLAARFIFPNSALLIPVGALKPEGPVYVFLHVKNSHGDSLSYVAAHPCNYRTQGINDLLISTGRLGGPGRVVQGTFIVARNCKPLKVTRNRV